MDAVAKLRNAPISARKMGLLAKLIRGQRVAVALAILHQKPQQAAVFLKKLLLSAMANWQDHSTAPLEEAHMYVKKITVDRAGMYKRIMPAPRGVVHKIRKRSSHVMIVVEGYPQLATLLERLDRLDQLDQTHEQKLEEVSPTT